MIETKVHTPNRHIVFYDGDCMLCNSTVQWLLSRRLEDLYFCSLQSPRATQYLPPNTIRLQSLNTMYLLSDGRLYSHSTAALRVMMLVGAAYKILGSVLLLIPRFIRDGVYRMIARYRHIIVGKQKCLLPTPSQRKQIL